MMIINPLSGGGIKGLFSTHAPIGQRSVAEAAACDLGPV